MNPACLTSCQVASQYVLFLACCTDCAAVRVSALAPSFLHRYLSLLVICYPFPSASSLLLQWIGPTWNCSWGHLLPCISLWSLSLLPSAAILKWPPITVSHMQLSILGWSSLQRSAGFGLVGLTLSTPTFCFIGLPSLQKTKVCPSVPHPVFCNSEILIHG